MLHSMLSRSKEVGLFQTFSLPGRGPVVPMRRGKLSYEQMALSLCYRRTVFPYWYVCHVELRRQCFPTRCSWLEKAAALDDQNRLRT